MGTKKGDIIRNLRISKNMTQEEVGKVIGTSKQTLHKYETGIITNIPQDKIEALANLFDVSPAYIMGWETKYEDVNVVSLENKLSKPEKELIDNYNKSNEDGKQIILDTSRNISKTYPMVTREEMIEFLREIPMAAYNGNLNINTASDEELYKIYKIIKKEDEE